MVNPNDIDTLSSELENRLDDLFGENDIQLPDALDKDIQEHYPLAELKNLILSIDWEITDEALNSLLQQLEDLLLTYKHDKIVTTFLQILNSLGKYIRAHRSKAHPKTFKILNSVFSSLDKVVLSKDMAESAKKKILRAEMNRYKDLRTQIDKSKAAAAKRKIKSVDAKAPQIKDKEEAPISRSDEPSAGRESKASAEEPVLTLDEPSAAPESKASAEEAVLTLDEPSAAPESKASAEEAVLTLDEPSAEPESKAKDEEPVFTLDEPSAAPESKAKDEEPVFTLDEPSAAPESKPKAEEPVLALDEAAGAPVVADGEDLPVTRPDSERDPAAALAEAVEEIKRYIHTEIKALKEEIVSIREQK